MSLGSAVTVALLADGHNVRAHVRSTEAAGRLPEGVESQVGDLGDDAWLRARIDGSDGVVHTASPNDATGGSFDAAFLDVALPALAGSDRPLVHTGGTWIHGSGDPITEESPIDPPSTVAWRPAILQRLQAAAFDGIRTVVIAPANLYGAGAGIPALLRGAPTTDEPNQRCCTSATATSASPTSTEMTSPRYMRSQWPEHQPGPTTWAPTRRARR